MKKLLGQLLIWVSLAVGVMSATTAYVVSLDLPDDQLVGLTLASPPESKRDTDRRVAASEAVRVFFRHLDVLALAPDLVTESDAFVRLYWTGDEFPREPLPVDRLWCDGSEQDLVKGTALRTGREAVATRLCLRCRIILQQSLDLRVVRYVVVLNIAVFSHGFGPV